MRAKEATIRNYQHFLPILENLPYTHRYWLEFKEKYYPDEPELDDDVASRIITQISESLTKIHDMSDDEFDECDCIKKPCLAFHDPQHKIIRECNIDKNSRLEYTPQEDNVDGKIKVKLISKNDLDNPLVLSRDIFYGNIKHETRYKDNTETEIESVIEEVQ